MSSSLSAVAVYARVSSQRQAQQCTIASQLAALRERVVQDGCTWSEGLCFVDDGCSGATLLRPALERLRDAAANDLFERLYVLAPDRMARRHAHQALLLDELQRLGIEVVFLNRAIGTSPEDDLLLQVQGVIAEHERAKIQERSRRGKRHAAQRGAVSVFSTAPYGYRYVPKTTAAGARYEILDDEAGVVQSIFAWVAQERCSIREVCRRLQKQGIPTRSGRTVWEPATVRGLLRNPAYCGQAAYGKTGVGERRPRLRPQRGRPEVPRRPGVSSPRPNEEWIHVPVPAIISEELFQAVAEQLSDNRQRHRARSNGPGHLLQGLVVCQCCGYACYGQSARAAAGRPRYGYYRCIGTDRCRADGQRVCHLPTVPLTPLDEAVWKDVRDLLADPQRIEAEHQRRRQESSAAAPERAHLEARRQRAQNGLSRIIDAYADGLLDRAELEPRLRAARQRLSELDAEHKLLLERETREQQLHVVIRHLEQFAERVHQGLDSADAELRRELIRALVRRVELGLNDVYEHVGRGGEVRDVEKALADHVLEVPSVIAVRGWGEAEGPEYRLQLEEAKRRMELARRLGATYVVATPPRALCDHQQIAARYKDLLQIGREIGVKPTLEHISFFRSLSKPSQAWQIVEQIDDPDATVVLDAFHHWNSGSTLDDLRPIPVEKISHYHIDDALADPPPTQQTDPDRVMPGDGVIDLRAEIELLREKGYQGAVSLELFNPALWEQDPRDVLRRGLERLRALVDE